VGRRTGPNATPENESSHSRNRHLECHSAELFPLSGLASTVSLPLSLSLSLSLSLPLLSVLFPNYARHYPPGLSLSVDCTVKYVR